MSEPKKRVSFAQALERYLEAREILQLLARHNQPLYDAKETVAKRRMELDDVFFGDTA